MNHRRLRRQSHPAPYTGFQSHQSDDLIQSTPTSPRPRMLSSVRRRRSSTTTNPESDLFAMYRTLAPNASSKPFVDVKVSDFVTLPQGGRRSSARHSIGPVDVAVRPPSYNLVIRPCSEQTSQQQTSLKQNRRRHSLQQTPSSKCDVSQSDPLLEMAPQKVFLIDDTEHVDRLLNIVTATDKKNRDSLSSFTEDPSTLTHSSPMLSFWKPASSEITEDVSEDFQSFPIHDHDHLSDTSNMAVMSQSEDEEDDLSDQLEDAHQLSDNDQNSAAESDSIFNINQHDDDIQPFCTPTLPSSTADASSSQLVKIFYNQSKRDRSLGPDASAGEYVLPFTDGDSFSDLRIESDEEAFAESVTSTAQHIPNPVGLDRDDATELSSLISTSSFASSLAEIFSVRTSNSIDTTSLNCMDVGDFGKHSQSPTTYVAVKAAENLADERRRAGLTSLLQKNTPAPVKYTFRPLHKVMKAAEVNNNEQQPSSIEKSGITDNHEIMPMINTPPRRSDESNRSNKSTKSVEPPTLAAVRSVVDKIDPRTAIGIVNAAPPGLGIFRRTNATKRLSDESDDSVRTQYYEDDYTKFIEKKTSGHKLKYPLSRMIATEGWSIRSLPSSRSDDRSASPLSISTSDEYYNPTAGIANDACE